MQAIKLNKTLSKYQNNPLVLSKLNFFVYIDSVFEPRSTQF